MSFVHFLTGLLELNKYHDFLIDYNNFVIMNAGVAVPTRSGTNVPKFSIPPSYKGRHTPLLEKRLEEQSLPSKEQSSSGSRISMSSSCGPSFLCNLSGQSRSQHRTSVQISNQKKTDENGIFYDPGLQSGMTLKHIPYTTSPYGFPVLQKPASWTIDESMFHVDESGGHNHRFTRHRSNAFNCGLSTASTTTTIVPKAKKARSSSAPCSMLIRRKSELKASEVDRQMISLRVRQGRNSAPVVYSNLSESGTKKSGSASASSNQRPHQIMFSSTCTADKIYVDPHSVCLPSNPTFLHQVETRVCVWLAAYDKRPIFCRKQFTSWMPEIGDKTTHFDGNGMTFKLYQTKSSNLFIHFKVISRYNNMKGRSTMRTVGKVVVPLTCFERPRYHVTRLLEATPKVRLNALVQYEVELVFKAKIPHNAH